MSAKEVKIEKIVPSERWVRAEFGGEYVVSSKRPILVWEHSKYPTYFFPQEDVRMDLLEEAGETSSRNFWTVQVNGSQAERAAYTYVNQPELDGYLTIKWHEMDHWYEEEQEVFVHPRDPFKRVDVMPSSRHVRVEIDGVTLADTKRPSLLFETNLPTRYYIPPEDVKMDYLTPTDTETKCPYKGTASYWDVTVGEKVYEDLVWSYPDPIPECPKIEGLLCFYNEKVDLFVDGELEERPKTYWS